MSPSTRLADGSPGGSACGARRRPTLRPTRRALRRGAALLALLFAGMLAFEPPRVPKLGSRPFVSGPGRPAESASGLQSSRPDRDRTDSARWRAALRLRAAALRAPERERDAARRRATRALRPFWDLDRLQSEAENDPAARARAAEAAFRSGELSSWLGDADDAARAFRAAARWGSATGFGGRAWLELGHVLRRVGRVDEALDAYSELVHEGLAPALQRDEARLWSGRLHAERGDLEAARRLWHACAQAAEDPVQRVRAWDALVVVWVDSGDLEAAAGCLATAYAELGPLAKELTEHGARVDRALKRMRCIAYLAQAVRARRAARVDSEDDHR